MRKSLVSSVMAAAIILTGASAASASTVTPQGACQGGYINVASNSGSSFQQAAQANSSVTGGPGVTLSISTSTTFTVSGSITATAEVSVDAVVASVKTGVGVTIGQSKSGTTTNAGTWTVPSNYQVGRLAIGSMKYRGSVTRYYESGNCTRAKVGSSASYNAPQQEWHFQTSRVQ